LVISSSSRRITHEGVVIKKKFFNVGARLVVTLAAWIAP
jgi:hypothetical protein